eukprot:3802267-Amphidinium_carterae.1
MNGTSQWSLMATQPILEPTRTEEKKQERANSDTPDTSNEYDHEWHCHEYDRQESSATCLHARNDLLSRANAKVRFQVQPTTPPTR